MAQLLNTLGGTVGFGENALERNDDGSTVGISLAEAFPNGLNFFGRNFTSLYVNNNGSVSFANPIAQYTPSAITGQTSNPIIAPYWADVDTRGTPGTVTPGGTSRGTNLAYYDQDAASGTFTVTWDDVGYFNMQVDNLNAFQLRLTRVGGTDFDIEFRYEDVNWTTGAASSGSGGLGGTPARAGYSSGNGVNFFELPQSGDEAALLQFETAGNAGEAGLYRFNVRSLSGAGATSTPADEVFSGQENAINTLVLPIGLRSATVTPGARGPQQVSGAGIGSDTLFSIETLSFADGRLVFDQNDPVAQVLRLYQAALGRAPDQGGLNDWTGRLQQGQPLGGLANGFLGSDEFNARFPGADDPTGFVTLLYQNVLGRAPDTAGLSNWVNSLNAGTQNRAQVLIGFSESPENVQRTGSVVANGIWDRSETAATVARLYDTVFGRAPDAGGLISHVNALNGGAPLSAIASGFTNSPEFQQAYGALTNSAFVEALYVNTFDRVGDRAGVANWVSRLDTGTSRADVVIGFSESLEHIQQTAGSIQPESGTFGILFA